MLDAILLEDAGVPAAVICTDQFTQTGHIMADVWNLPGYKFGVIPHPIANLGPAGVTERARTSLPQVVALLTGGRR